MTDVGSFTSYIGIVSFTLSGVLLAARKHFDLLGVVIISTITAMGGGVIRDVLINRIPFFLTNIVPFITIISVIAVALLLKLHKRDDLERKLIFVASDAIGLVAFSVTGALAGIETHMNLLGVMSLAFITAVGGGIIRDIIVNEVPFIFKSEFYGSVALLIALVLYVLNMFGHMTNPIVCIVSVAAVALRLLAYIKDWHLPKIS